MCKRTESVFSVLSYLINISYLVYFIADTHMSTEKNTI